MSFEGCSNSVNQNDVNLAFDLYSLYDNPRKFISLVSQIREFYLTQKWDEALIQSCDRLIKSALLIETTHQTLSNNQFSNPETLESFRHGIVIGTTITDLEVGDCTVLDTLGPALVAISALGACFVMNRLSKKPIEATQNFNKRLKELQIEKDNLMFKIFMTKFFCRNLLQKGLVRIEDHGLVKISTGKGALLYGKAVKTEENLLNEREKIEKIEKCIQGILKILNSYVLANLSSKLSHLNTK